MNRAPLLCAITLTLFAPGSTRAETAAPASPAVAALPVTPVLTLEECVARALDRNFSIEIQRYSSSSAREGLIEADAAFDSSVALNTTDGYSRSAALGNIVSGSQRDSASTVLSVSRKIEAGTTFAVSTNLASNKSGGGGTPLNPAFNGALALNVTQPLLKGAGSEINLAPRQLAQYGVVAADASLKSSVLTVISGVESAYFNLAFAREQLGVRQFTLKVAQQLLDENQIRRSTGVLTDLEVLQAEVGVANAQQNLLLADQTLHNSEDALLQLIGRFEFDQTLGAVKLPDDPVPAVSVANSYSLAKTGQPDYVTARALLKESEINVRIAKDSLRPQLNLGGGLGLNSLEGSYGNVVDQLPSGRGYDWQLSLSLTFPWGFRAENARYRQAIAALDSQQAALGQIDQNLLVQVRTAVRNVLTSQESVANTALSRQLSEKQYELEKARFDAGLDTFRFVQDAEDALGTARIAELQARVSLRTALAQLASLEGSSLARYRIKLKE